MLMEMGICNGPSLPNISFKISEESKNLIIKIRLSKRIKLFHPLILKYLTNIKSLKLLILGQIIRLRKLFI